MIKVSLILVDEVRFYRALLLGDFSLISTFSFTFILRRHLVLNYGRYQLRLVHYH